MKNIYFVFLFLSSVIILSCDKVDEPYTSAVPAKDWYGKRILLEDYTGHTCINCPAAAAVAANIKTLYGDKVIIISVHADYFAKPVLPEFPEDFRTTAGEIWYKFFGFLGNPYGMINRKGFTNSTQILGPGAWAAKVGSIMTELPEVEISVAPIYDSTTKTLTGNVKTKFLKTIRKKLKLQIVLTEDSIVAPQKDGNITVPNYIHRHMMRGAINGSWGSVLTDGLNNTPIETELSQNILFTFDSSWKSKHCTVVAFVYDADTYEILQVAEKHLE
ncbi:MAG: Omp28 family outer membrane lipoprotein [Bacteroidales bacterium]